MKLDKLEMTPVITPVQTVSNVIQINSKLNSITTWLN